MTEAELALWEDEGGCYPRVYVPEEIRQVIVEDEEEYDCD